VVTLTVQNAAAETVEFIVTDHGPGMGLDEAASRCSPSAKWMTTLPGVIKAAVLVCPSHSIWPKFTEVVCASRAKRAAGRALLCVYRKLMVPRRSSNTRRKGGDVTL